MCNSSSMPGPDSGRRNAIDGAAQRLHTDRYGIYLALLLSLFAILNFIKGFFQAAYIDEAAWWLQTKHLTAGYFGHPPFVAYQQFVVTKLFGSSAPALRLGAIFFATLSLYLVFVLSREIFEDRKLAFWSTLLIALVPVTNFRLPIGFQEAPFIFFCLLTILLLWRAIDRESKGYWYLAGISAGFTLLCKLQAVFLFLGILLFLATSRRHRHWLKHKEPYLGFLIAVAMFVPTIVWYAQHHFEPITYQLTNRPSFLTAGLSGYIRKIIVHAYQEMLSLSPFVYLFSLAGIVYGGWLGFKGKDQRFLFLFWFSAPVILFFTLAAGSRWWEFPGHIISLIAAMGAFSLLLQRTSSQRLRKAWRPLFVVLLLLFSLLYSMGLTYVMSGDVTRYGWRELAQEVETVREGIPGGEDAVMAAPYYWIPSEVAYHEKDNPMDYTLAFRVYESEFFGDNSNYTPWVPLDKLVGRDFIFVDEKDNRDGYETPITYWDQKLPPYFEKVDEPITFVVQKKGRDFRTFYIFKCYGFKGPDEDMDVKGEVRDTTQS